mmetsp:Transcript_49576/g.131056  ORF Transcript_49576/g.131056 Transcript_49576/m.131056 type:complete len:122 (+) Transcript_49576:397-762(+)
MGREAIMVSRSFGDLQFKHGDKLPKGEALLLCTPSVSVRALRPEHLCAVVASDGFWDVISDDRAAGLVLEGFRESSGPPAWTEERARQCARALVEEALRAKTKDNVSVAVLGFRWDGTGSG